MAYKNNTKKINKEKKSASLWNRVLKQDIYQQANFVEFMGWIGLVVFLVLLGMLWTVKIDVTIPATEAKLVELSSGDFVIEAKLAEKYVSNISKKQLVNLKFLSAQNDKIKSNGEIIETKQKPDSAALMIKIKPTLDTQTLQVLSQDLKSIQPRIIIQEKKLISLLLEKQPF